jgi:predicted nucleic acid-binding protein
LATERVVIDASAGVRASLTDGWRALGAWHLVAPTLFWSEATAGISQLLFRGEITDAEASASIDRLHAATVEPTPSRDLIVDALALSRRLGWAKTYDAEFLALARLRGAKVLTTDARLRRGADRTGLVIDPSEL